MDRKAHEVTFALIAVRERYLTLDDVIAATRDWKGSDQPLDQLLVRVGLLDEERRAAVEAAVRHEIEGHDAPEHTFPAPAHAPLEPLPRVTEPGAQETLGGRYSIVKHFATGGLGVVWLAHDQEVNREVAVKEIQVEHAAHAGWKHRFMQEAEITGRLEHPGVVPVYGMGRRDDGRPFYAMRLIRGRTLQEEIDRHHAERATATPSERSLAFRKLLEHFISACHTIEHAHSRGIIHRDIKPANIMVGRHGETVILDWGLAKPVEQADDARAELPSDMGAIDIEGGSARTVMGSTIGTPQYMSPEQAQGRLDLLGFPSDVYSLGATLYCILAGRAPVEKGPAAEVMARAGRGEFPPPRAVKREVPAALEAICLKAMALKMENRYASPTELEEDVERWMADEPTTAFPETTSTRILRWMRRHRLVAMVGGAALIAITALSLSSAARIRGALALEQAARLSAQRRLKDATEATGKLVEVTARVRELPGGRSVTRSLLATAEVLYATLERDSDGEADIRFQSARTRSQLARALWVYGDLEGGIERYQSAIETVTQLKLQTPGNKEYRSQLASMQRSLADLLAEMPDHDRNAQRDALLTASQQELESLTQEFESDARLQTSLAQTLSSLGASQRARDPALATRALERAAALFETLIAAGSNPASVEGNRGRGEEDRRWVAWFGRGRVRHELGLIAEDRRDLESARTLYDTALADMTAAAERTANLPLYVRQRLTAVRSQAGRLALRQGRLDDAERAIGTSHREHSAALEADRESWRVAWALAQDGWALSDLQARRLRAAEADRELARVQEMLKGFGAPASRSGRDGPAPRLPLPLGHALAMTLSSAGLRLTARSDPGGPALLREAVDLTRAWPEAHARGADARAVHAIVLANLARTPGAMPAPEAAAALSESLRVASAPDVREAWERWRTRPGLAIPDLDLLDKR